MEINVDKMTPEQIRKAYEATTEQDTTSAMIKCPNNPGQWIMTTDPNLILNSERAYFVPSLDEGKKILKKLFPGDAEFPELETIQEYNRRRQYDSTSGLFKYIASSLSIIPPAEARWETWGRDMNWDRAMAAAKKYGSIRVRVHTPPNSYRIDLECAGNYLLLKEGCYLDGYLLTYDPKKVKKIYQQRLNSKKRKKKDQERYRQETVDYERVVYQGNRLLEMCNDWVADNVHTSLRFNSRLNYPGTKLEATKSYTILPLMLLYEDVISLEHLSPISLHQHENFSNWFRNWLPEYQEFCAMECPPETNSRLEFNKCHQFWTWWHSTVSTYLPGLLREVDDQWRDGPPALPLETTATNKQDTSNANGSNTRDPDS